MSEITPTPRVGTLLELDVTLDGTPEPRVGTLLRFDLNPSYTAQPRVGTLLRLDVRRLRRPQRGLGLVR